MDEDKSSFVHFALQNHRYYGGLGGVGILEQNLPLDLIKETLSMEVNKDMYPQQLLRPYEPAVPIKEEPSEMTVKVKEEYDCQALADSVRSTYEKLAEAEAWSSNRLILQPPLPSLDMNVNVNGTTKKPRRHKGANSQKCFNCGVCGKELLTKHAFQMHMVTHIGHLAINNYSCSVCGKSVSTEMGVKRHSAIHSDVKNFKCTLCGKGLTTKLGLERHMATHNPIKEFNCNVCGKGFSTKQGFQRHMASHSEIKFFNCRFCGKGFSTKQLLQRHLVNHRSDKEPPRTLE